jgi:ribosomal protein L27
MLVIYRGWGLAWAGAGLVILPMFLVLTGSVSCPLVVISALWIRYGRARIDKDSGETIPSPSVFFIPIWFYGAVLSVVALVMAGVETVNGRVVNWGRDLDEGDTQLVQNEIPDEPLDTDPQTVSGFAPDDTLEIDGRPKPNQAETSTRTPPKNTTTKPPAPSSRAVPEIEIAFGELVTDETELAPGQTLAASWGRKWYQVSVVADDDRSVRVDWLGSNTWKANRVARTTLRIVSEEEFEKCSRYGNDDPVSPGEILANDVVIKIGDMLVCEAFGNWLPVRVQGVEDDGLVKISWLNFDEKWNESVGRDRLRTPFDKSEARSKSRSSKTGTSADGKAPGTQVTDETELAPGQKLARNWARKWYQVIVVGMDDSSVLVDYPGSNGWKGTRIARKDLRVVSDEEFENCPQYGDDAPTIPGEAVDSGTDVTTGEFLLFGRCGSWLPVRVINVAEDGAIMVDWLGFEAKWNRPVGRDQLRTVEKNSPGARNLSSLLTKYSARHQEPGPFVTDESDLKVGSILLRRTGPRWFPVEVVSANGDEVSVRNWTRTNDTVTLKRSELRFPTIDP